ncbi:inscuteable -like protein [Brachionus plicatilis]|uniref:Inscuteable-like protein n=1 Tax=Brachionus plicatilis TaxID=10195 RepID=A0A3M7QT35_BRAPC|nr:inscuteable -like protein [Brachionus plicatilis]
MYTNEHDLVVLIAVSVVSSTSESISDAEEYGNMFSNFISRLGLFLGLLNNSITTILANMALLENCRYDISEFNGLNLLIDFLNEQPSNYMSLDSSRNTVESELNACERVQQKAAIAISRFCKEAKYTSQLIDLGGEFISELKQIFQLRKMII